MRTILVTGSAGFIGFHLAQRLLDEGYVVIGLDSIDPYYDTDLKYARLQQLGIMKEKVKDASPIISEDQPSFTFYKGNLEDRMLMQSIFATHKIQVVVNLAAQAGVRYSIENPYTYVNSNVMGFVTLLEMCKDHKIEHLVYASSSSVYGLNQDEIFSTEHAVDHPISVYAASKRANELFAHSYSHLFRLPTTGLRFFTVYGPWGRPDMAYYSFAKDIVDGKEIKIFNEGQMQRDFTYIDDIVESIVRIIPQPPAPAEAGEEFSTAKSSAPFTIYNIGNNSPVNLLRFVEVLEDKLGTPARKKYMPMQPGDVVSTYANVEPLINRTGYQPNTPIELGIERFVEWFTSYYKVKPVKATAEINY